MKKSVKLLMLLCAGVAVYAVAKRSSYGKVCDDEDYDFDDDWDEEIAKDFDNQS